MTSDIANRFDEPFFIFGCGRSGTSLLSRMLNQHPNLAVPYESHLFNTFYPLLHYYGDLSVTRNRERLIRDILSIEVMRDWDPGLTFQEISKLVKKNNFHGIFDAIMIAWASKNNKIRWGEKTPSHIDYWEKIVDYWPAVKIVHIVRDGRDVALSLMNARFGPKTVYASARYWKRYLDKVEILKRNYPEDQIYSIKYEELIDNASEVLKGVCGFLGEEYSPLMLEFYTNDAPYRTDNENRKNLMKPVLKDNKNKWATKMSENEIRFFENAAGNYLELYGYKRALKEAHITGLEDFYLSNIKSPALKINAMAKNRKGHKDALIRVMIHLRMRLFGWLITK